MMTAKVLFRAFGRVCALEGECCDVGGYRWVHSSADGEWLRLSWQDGEWHADGVFGAPPELPGSAAEAGWASVAEIARAMRLDRPTAHVSYTCEVGAVRITWTLSASGVCDFGRYGAREVA